MCIRDRGETTEAYELSACGETISLADLQEAWEAQLAVSYTHLGDLSARTDLHGEDEIARLGETFDEMADSVEKDRELERRLTTDVAHELRTPLMAIQSTVEAMVDGVFEADPEHLETVNSEVQRLSRLVDSLLKLSRLENRANPMKEEVVDVGQLISGIIATHDAFVTDSGLTLEYQADEGVRVLGDADMIRQATANPVSYTHLDVYKRQPRTWPSTSTPTCPRARSRPAAGCTTA